MRTTPQLSAVSSQPGIEQAASKRGVRIDGAVAKQGRCQRELRARRLAALAR
ncbi:MAG: hypothetical protein H6834_09605 [Planctomycetes bacterium]|nr:hypothetical protein [Planctomycetota bacterium]